MKMVQKQVWRCVIEHMSLAVSAVYYVTVCNLEKTLYHAAEMIDHVGFPIGA